MGVRYADSKMIKHGRGGGGTACHAASGGGPKGVGGEGPRSVVGSVGIATCWRPYRALSSPDSNWVNP